MSTDVPEVELGAGGTGIAGTIAVTQLAVGTAPDTIGGFAALTYDGFGTLATTIVSTSTIAGTPDLNITGLGNTTLAPAGNLLIQPTGVTRLVGAPDGFVKTSAGDGTLSIDTSTYITAAALAPYLTSASAAATYLTIANAAATYLTIANAAATYLTIANAAATYLTIATAASTYQPLLSLTNTELLWATGAHTVGQSGSLVWTNASLLLTTANLTVTDTIIGTHVQVLIGKFTGEISLVAGDGTQNGVAGLDAVDTAGNHQTVVSDARNARVTVLLQNGGNLLIGANAGAGSAVYGSQGVVILEQAATAPTSAPAKDHIAYWVDGSTGSFKCRTNTATYTLAV